MSDGVGLRRSKRIAAKLREFPDSSRTPHAPTAHPARANYARYSSNTYHPQSPTLVNSPSDSKHKVTERSRIRRKISFSEKDTVIATRAFDDAEDTPRPWNSRPEAETERELVPQQFII